MSNGEVFVQSAEDSRRNARMPIDKLVEHYAEERQKLVDQKREIERQIAEVESWRMEQTSLILGKRLAHAEQVRATVLLESQAKAKRNPLLREMQGIEKLLHDMKSRHKSANIKRADNTPGPMEKILLRIESLMMRLVTLAEQASEGDAT